MVSNNEAKSVGGRVAGGEVNFAFSVDSSRALNPTRCRAERARKESGLSLTEFTEIAERASKPDNPQGVRRKGLGQDDIKEEGSETLSRLPVVDPLHLATGDFRQGVM
jgi:hypothetical protein